MDYRRILVFGAHPDDEITMAATIAKLADSGVAVTVAILTDGCEGYPCAELKSQIVALRRQEMAACDEVLGIVRRYFFNRPDAGLANDKEVVQECVRLIREVKPEAAFTHGPMDRHRDHVATHEISMEALWHASEPVMAELGPKWHTPHVYWYKGYQGARPRVVLDVTGYAHKRPEALATQESQHTLFGRTRQQFLAEAGKLKQEKPQASDTFWLADWLVLEDFPPR